MAASVPRPAAVSTSSANTGDPVLLSPAPPWPSEVDHVPLVDPVQQWWDLLDLSGKDRREAAERLRRAILDRALPRPR